VRDKLTVLAIWSVGGVAHFAVGTWDRQLSPRVALTARSMLALS
jgi:hypothetical protein